MNLERGHTGERARPKRRATRGVPTPAGLVELVPMTRGTIPPKYVVQIHGVSVELGDDFREETLRRIVSALKSC